MFTSTNFNVCGKFFLALSALMAAPLAISLVYKQSDSKAFLLSMLISAALGLALSFFFRSGHRELRIRDGYTLVGLIWLGAGILGSLPFYFSGSVPTLVDAIFESVSGFTTTGATVLASVEDKPMGILFWRSLSHWLGGMGIIVLSVAFLPRLGSGAMQLFRAEVPGPSAERLLPRIKETAKVLWILYAALTLLLFALLMVAGMGWFDAINHALATMATGGSSTKNLSIGAYSSPWIHWILTIFMIAAGINFTLYYYLYNRRWTMVREDRELRFYLWVVTIVGAILTCNLFFSGTFTSFGESIRQSFFQMTSIISTTGFSSADFDKWPSFARGLLAVLSVIGGSAGSTAGAIKQIRILIMFKFIGREFYRLLHPKIVRPVRIGPKVISEEMLHNITGFILLYFLIFIGAGLAVSAMGVDVVSAFTGAAASIGNVGPGLELLGPLNNYGTLPWAAKIIYVTCMLLGRLELFTFALFLAHPFMNLVEKFKLRSR